MDLTAHQIEIEALKLPASERARLAERLIASLDDEEFRKEAHRQSLAVASSRHEADDQAFIDSVSELGDH